MDQLKPRYDLPAVTVRSVDTQLVSSSEKTLTTPPLQPSCSKREFFRAMVALTTLKRTSEFTKQQLNAWFCVLRRFPAATINLAVVELATSQTRFPEVSDLFRLCQAKMPRGYVPMSGDDDLGKPPPSVVRQIAQDLGLSVD